MSRGDQFIPVVPYNSFKEYQDMLAELIRNYQAMVKEGVEIANIENWIRVYEGLSFGAKDYWLEHGKRLFLQMTKGLGDDWCYTMNLMVVHALDTCLRVVIETHRGFGMPLSGSPACRLLIATFLAQEAEKAIADPKDDPNNMSEFFDRNFVFIVYGEDWWDDSDWIPIKQLQEMQVAFAMLTHARLGHNALGHMLGLDVIKTILYYVTD